MALGLAAGWDLPAFVDAGEEAPAALILFAPKSARLPAGMPHGAMDCGGAPT